MSRLLEHGEVECVCSDNSTRQVALRISAPWCIVQAAMPLLLGRGFIDQLKVKNPLIAWTPPLAQDRFLDSAIAQVPNLAEKATVIIRERIMEMLQIFCDLSHVLKNPDDAISILPMNVYVEFQFRSTYEKFAAVVEEFKPINTPGVAELRYAMAVVLAEILSNAGDIHSLEFNGNHVPAQLGITTASDGSEVILPSFSAQFKHLPGKNG